MKFNPINNYLSLKMINFANPIIILTDNERKEYRWGEVLETGPGFPDFNGLIEPSQLAPGDVVYVMAHGRELLDLESLDLGTVHVASELDIMCVLEDKDSMKIKPLGALIEIERIQNEVTPSTILRTDSKTSAPSTGIVKSIGKGWKDASGNPIEFHVEVNDTVIFDPMKVMVVDLEPLGINEKKHLIMHTDIYGVVK